MANPILVTGAAGRVGGMGRVVTALLLRRMTEHGSAVPKPHQSRGAK